MNQAWRKIIAGSWLTESDEWWSFHIAKLIELQYDSANISEMNEWPWTFQLDGFSPWLSRLPCGHFVFPCSLLWNHSCLFVILQQPQASSDCWSNGVLPHRPTIAMFLQMPSGMTKTAANLAEDKDQQSQFKAESCCLTLFVESKAPIIFKWSGLVRPFQDQ